MKVIESLEEASAMSSSSPLMAAPESPPKKGELLNNGSDWDPENGCEDLEKAIEEQLNSIEEEEKAEEQSKNEEQTNGEEKPDKDIVFQDNKSPKESDVSLHEEKEASNQKDVEMEEENMEADLNKSGEEVMETEEAVNGDEIQEVKDKEEVDEIQEVKDKEEEVDDDDDDIQEIKEVEKSGEEKEKSGDEKEELGEEKEDLLNTSLTEKDLDSVSSPEKVIDEIDLQKASSSSADPKVENQDQTSSSDKVEEDDKEKPNKELEQEEEPSSTKEAEVEKPKAQICLVADDDDADEDEDSDTETDTEKKTKDNGQDTSIMDSESSTTVSTKTPEEEEEEKKEVVQEEEKLNYEEALNELTRISQNARKLDDDNQPQQKSLDADVGTKRKSTAEVVDGQTAKKAKTHDEEEDASASSTPKEASPKDQIKACLKKVARDELEEVVAKKMVEMISCRSEIGELRRKCDAYEESSEKWKRKTQMLTKMCQDLNTVMRRYIVDVQNKPKDKVAPIKITRSVGLQVMTDRRRANNAVASKSTTSTPTTPTTPAMMKRTIMASSATSSPITPTSSMNGVPAMKLNSPTRVVTTMSSQVVKSVNAVLPPTVTLLAAPSSSSSSSSPVPTANIGGSKKVIDVVDLSDEEDFSPVQSKQPNNKGTVRIVPTSQLRTAPTASPNVVVMSRNQGNVQSLNQVLVATSNNHPVGRYTLNGGTLVPMSKNNSTPATASASNMPNALVLKQANNLTLQRIPQVNHQRKNNTHPAPLPNLPALQGSNPHWKKLPPRPTLKISKLKNGIVLSWNMDLIPTEHAVVSSYQIYAYQESGQLPATTLWKKVGDVKALPLPMACTLTQFMKGNKYHFAVRAQDIHTRVGTFSEAQSIALM